MLFYVLIFIIGLCVGSFLNVVIFRLDRKAGILTGRSECQNCSYQLQWYDLFPVFSYLCLGGKCRHCKKPISPIYPIVELTTAVVFTVYLLVNGSQLVL